VVQVEKNIIHLLKIYKAAPDCVKVTTGPGK